ncbi:hypothetical protein K438DRAFT_1978419 [Mycena galopus ATCC 62051]|nr:hypothetical protein K438DRAFT_1978419 [Mycena galopus ATCC 62051]
MIGMQRCRGILRLFGRVDGRLISLLLLTITLYKRSSQSMLSPIQLTEAALNPKTVLTFCASCHRAATTHPILLCTRSAHSPLSLR